MNRYSDGINTEQIFRFLDPSKNDLLSEMNNYELQELIYLLNSFYLELRSKLGLIDDVTFGLELEFENANCDEIEFLMLKTRAETHESFALWKMDDDKTLYEGMEIISTIMSDDENNWYDLEKICTIVKSNAIIGHNSGGHVHIGTQVLGDKEESWLNFIKLWSVYENIIYRFAYGEFLTERTNIRLYASPMARIFQSDYNKLLETSVTVKEIVKKISHGRSQAVNFDNVTNYSKFIKNNTIEFRCPNGTLEPAIWQNNVNLFAHLLSYAKDLAFDLDTILKRENIINNKSLGLLSYREIHLEQAIELSDMIFDNNLDKIYFLRQYLKSSEVGVYYLEEAKPFTRSIKF